MHEVIAIDVDLGKITAVSSERGVLCHLADPSEMPAFWLAAPKAILLEIAGPVMHAPPGAKEACPYGKRRWMLYNAAWITKFIAFADGYCPCLVATSTDWTQGYDEAKRHAIAGMLPRKVSKTGAKLYDEPHDVREARAMLYFHSKNPKPWKSFDEWLKGLL